MRDWQKDWELVERSEYFDDEDEVLDFATEAREALSYWLQQVKELKAIAEALLECERERQQESIDGLLIAPPADKYFKAVKLALETLEGGET